jgi:hypothetical protein
LFCDKNFEKFHEESLEKSLKLDRNMFNKDKKFGSPPKKICSTR